ncbi:hypothetical protein E6C76_10960 [Pseudothauera nasutitermitis]|uniref:Uncharacterized protein n=1 Tax=Pseudothauera nasutitermitis TaxID=2565930 RepID=A0A4S4AY52_9RHOO|nr:hypothetical protein [Pseudothauera nasutitermitis]THF64576.1 hypothetical protein E6C76_10960 [Pseudothauera nasutitermitis]
MNTKGFSHNIQILPPALRLKATIAKELYPLSRGYYERGKQLCEVGLQSHLALQNDLDRVFNVTPIEKQEEMEENLFLVSTDICHGAYWSKYLNDERMKDILMRMETAKCTGNQWESESTQLGRRLTKMRVDNIAEFIRCREEVLDAIQLRRDAELKEFTSKLDANEIDRIETKKTTQITIDTFRSMGFNRGKSRPGLLVFTLDFCEDWNWVFLVDSSKLRFSIIRGPHRAISTGSLDLWFGICRNANAGSAAAKKNVDILFNLTKFFPISRRPIQDVYSSFMSLMELRFVIEAKIKMFRLIATDMECALKAGIEEVEARGNVERD